MTASKKTLHVDGSEFSTLEGFYDHVSLRIVPGAEWGRNLDAFNDILRGGFGTPEEGFISAGTTTKSQSETLDMTRLPTN
jgi:RNAse (barnase) inhibitor barstar